uniref:Uncharacterized protein n=1 Tax=Arundo donax TaxID=35708 RepID=A0A0A9BU01_ARUDO
MPSDFHYMSFRVCSYAVCTLTSQGVWIQIKDMGAGIQLGFGCRIWLKGPRT